MHGKDSCNGHPLLLSAGKYGRRMGSVGSHTHLFQCHIHPLPDFVGRNADIFRTEGHVFLHDSRYQLVIRILENHAHLLPDIPDMGEVGGLHAFHIDFSVRRNEQGVQMPGQRGFPAAVRPDDGRKGPLLYGGRYIGKGIKFLSFLCLEGMCQMTDVKQDLSALFFILHRFCIHDSSFLQ